MHFQTIGITGSCTEKLQSCYSEVRICLSYRLWVMNLPENLLQSHIVSQCSLEDVQIFVQFFKSVYERISKYNSNRNYRNWLLAAQTLLTRNVEMAWNFEEFRYEKCRDHIKPLRIPVLEDNNIWCCCMRNVEIAWSSERFRHCKTNNVRSC